MTLRAAPVADADRTAAQEVKLVLQAQEARRRQRVPCEGGAGRIKGLPARMIERRTNLWSVAGLFAGGLAVV